MMAHNIFAAISETTSAGGGKLESFTPRGQDSMPSDALPGSQEKIEILARRVETGVELHHPHDVRDWDDLMQLSK